jgi:tRNA A-37 threonylcarbamoyl transferase component Bud32
MMQLFELSDPEYGIDGTPLDPKKLRVLNELVKDLVGTQFDVVKKERLRSKKNIVYHVILKPERQVEVNFIVKAFVTGNYEMEVRLLKQCAKANLKVPEIIDTRDGVLLLSFIDGELLVDIINRTYDTKLIDDVAQWYFDFHSFQKLLKGDPRLRNFIVGSDGLYGVDFEEATEGYWVVDLGGVAASLLDTDPINEQRKQAMVWQLLDSYLVLKGIDRTADIEQDYLKVISNTLRQTAKWRNSNILTDLANEIEKNGLPQ